VAADSADVVEGVCNMGVAMRFTQPTQVCSLCVWLALLCKTDSWRMWNVVTASLTCQVLTAHHCPQVVLTSAKETTTRLENSGGKGGKEGAAAAAAAAANKVRLVDEHVTTASSARAHISPQSLGAQTPTPTCCCTHRRSVQLLNRKGRH
jgi:hypothetical protein